MDKQMFQFYKAALLGQIADTPLCEEYQQEWRACNDDKLKLVTLAMQQQSIPYLAHACYTKHGLTKDYLTTTFKDYINGFTIHDADEVKGYTYGLYVNFDYDKDLFVDKDVIHIMYTVGANVIIPTTKCPILYISNRSNIHLLCEGYNTIKLYLFDQAKVTIEEADETCNIVVYHYSTQSKCERGTFCISNHIHQHQKELKL